MPMMHSRMALLLDDNETITLFMPTSVSDFFDNDKYTVISNDKQDRDEYVILPPTTNTRKTYDS